MISVIDLLRDKAGEVAELRTIHYEADGTIKDIDIVKRNAENPDLTNHYILYYTDGKIKNIQWVEETAENTFKDHLFQVNFGTNGEIVGLTETEETAEGVKTKVHDFRFGADGKIMYDHVKEYTTYANGTTSDPIEYTLTAEDGQAYENVQSILTYLEDNYDGQTGEYYLDGDTEGVGEAVEEAEGKITDSQGKEGLGDYELDAKTDGVRTGVETAKQIIETGIATTDTTFHLKTVYDGTPQSPENPTTLSEDFAAFGNLVLGIFTDPEKAVMDFVKYKAEAELRNAPTYNEVPELTRGGNDLPSALYTYMWDMMESKGYPVPDSSDPNSIIIEPSGNFDTSLI